MAEIIESNSSQTVPVYDITLNNDVDVSRLAAVAEQAEKEGGKVVATNLLTKSITVAFPGNTDVSILQGSSDYYSVEKLEDVQAQGIFDVVKKFVEVGVKVGGSVLR